ncbi:MAG: YegS/Rv2252/BmrU family lipid kinase [Clostridia bacterium]|nr:YegS/Rv2252/BmrU family lipid kinase [Clostridia bacterium]
MEKILLMYNPNSGKKNIAASLDKIVEIFVQAGKLVTLYRIGSEYSFEQVLSDGDFNGLVVCGGDGSVNIAVKTILEMGIDIPIGVIPTGTCNDFSRSLGMPNDILLCARLIAQGKTAKTDIGIINGGEGVFVNELAGGVMVTASFSTDQNMKKMFGPLAYYVTGIGELANMKPFDMIVETEEQTYKEQALVFLVLNGTDISGFSNVIKEARMQDGEMDILIFKDANPLEVTDTLFRFVSGGEFKDSSVVRIRTSKCKITCDNNITTTIDGERGMPFPLKLEMKKQAVQIYC